MGEGTAISPVYSSIIGALALFVASGYIYLADGRKPYALAWTAAWGVYALRFVFEEILLSGGQPPVRLLFHGMLFLNAVLLFHGTLQLTRGKNRRRLLSAALPAEMATVLAYFLLPRPVAQDILIFAVAGLANVLSGALLIRDRPGRPPLRLAGWVMLFWGLHKLDYVPVQLFLPALAPHGYLLGGAFSLLLAGCLFALPIDAARERQLQSLKDVVLLIAAAVEERDPYTANHSRKVAALAGQMAGFLGFQPADREQVYFAGFLHDIGKIALSENILRKPGPLTADEYEQVKQHPAIGARILAVAEYVFGMVIPAVRHHHERWDGKDYPDGLAKESIPLEARILAVADALEAMVSDRPYRPGRPVHEALNEVIRCAGTQFCPRVVTALVKNWDKVKDML